MKKLFLGVFFTLGLASVSSFTSVDAEAYTHVCTYRMYSQGQFVGYWTLESVPDNMSCSDPVAKRVAINAFNDFHN